MTDLELKSYSSIVENKFNLFSTMKELTLYNKSILNNYQYFKDEFDSLIFNIKKNNLIFNSKDYDYLRGLLHLINEINSSASSHVDLKDDFFDEILFSFFYGVLDSMLNTDFDNLEKDLS